MIDFVKFRFGLDSFIQWSATLLLIGTLQNHLSFTPKSQIWSLAGSTLIYRTQQSQGPVGPDFYIKSILLSDMQRILSSRNQTVSSNIKTLCEKKF
jgi:hypothetical protein